MKEIIKFSFEKHIPEEDLENSTEKLINKAKKIFTIFAFSAITTFSPSAVHSQENGYKLKKDLKKEWSPTVLKPTLEMKKNIEEQKEWLISYIQSPKYKERLIKEYFCLKEIISSETSLDSLIDKLKNYNSDKKFNENSDTSLNSIKGNKIEYLEKLLPKIENIRLNEQELERIDKIISDRLENIQNGTIFIVDSITNEKSGWTTYGEYHQTNNEITVIQNLPKNNQTTPLHELVHLSTVGNNYMISTTVELLKSLVPDSTEDYYKSATEILARISVLRFLLDKNNIYNASLEDFNEDDYEEIFINKDILRNYNVEDLLSIFKEDELIWIMNNIADVNVDGKPALLLPVETVT